MILVPLHRQCNVARNNLASFRLGFGDLGLSHVPRHSPLFSTHYRFPRLQLVAFRSALVQQPSASIHPRTVTGSSLTDTCLRLQNIFPIVLRSQGSAITPHARWAAPSPRCPASAGCVRPPRLSAPDPSHAGVRPRRCKASFVYSSTRDFFQNTEPK
jgi:hypothetical protein